MSLTVETGVVGGFVFVAFVVGELLLEHLGHGLDLGLVGVADNHANGWLANLLVNYAAGDGLGLHTGVVNYFGGDFKGLQIGLANWIASGDMFQVGLYNGGYDIQGLQIGVINTADKLQGLQIGLVNIISNSDVSFFPIINGFF